MRHPMPCDLRRTPVETGLRAVVLGVTSYMAGCIFPPSLSVDVQDAGIDSPPAIIAVRSSSQELRDGDIALFAVNQMDTLNLTLLDTDVEDTLYVRIFVNYSPTNLSGPRAFCQSAAGASAVRTATCDTQALCLPEDRDGEQLMRIVVFDRQVLDSGTPAFMAMPAGGQSTSRVYPLRCSDQTPP